MYTQNFSRTQDEIFIKSFPNKDSILQMEALQNKATSTTDNKKIHRQNSNNILKNMPYEIILLFGALLCIPQTEEINSDIFLLISGILLSL